MAASTTFGCISSFDTWIFVAHEMWGMGDKIIVAVGGAKIIDDAEDSNGAAGGADVGSGRGYSGGFKLCRTFHPSSAAEGGRVEGGAGEDVFHSGGSGDVPTGEITGEGGGTIKRVIQSCHSRHIPCAQITGEGGGTIKCGLQSCHSLHIPFAQITGEGGDTSKRDIQICDSLHLPFA